MTRELMERRKAELIKQRDAFVANLQFANGAIAMLEELLATTEHTPETQAAD